MDAKLKALSLAADEAEDGKDEEEGNEEVRIQLKPGSCTTSAASDTLSHQCRNSRCPSLCLLWHHPLLLVVPTLLLIVIIALCVFGVTFATDNRINTQRQLAHVAARDAADALRLQLSVVSGAALTLATFVHVNPDWNQLEADFITVSEEIFRQANESSSYELAELTYAPFGRIAANYAPPDRQRGPVRTDLFAPENVARTKPFETVTLGSMTINGPLSLTVGGRMALIARYPVFIKNVSKDEDWNNPFNQTAPTGCEEICYDETTRTKFWGFTNAFFYADAIVSGEDDRLRQLTEENYDYRLTKSTDINDPEEGQRLIVESNGWDESHEPTALVDVRVPGAAWWLAVYNPEIDAIEQMRDGLIAMIVILAFLLSGLLLLLLISNKRAALLLEEQMITNQALEHANEHLTHTKRVLEEEKQQREALLGRQYDLISCFERKDSRKSVSTEKLSSSVTNKQHTTMEQIAALRRQMEMERQAGAHSNEDIRFCELLGEGTFGKVHRGTWRSTEVAIKTIMLPANMSGAEKREKMVVWEAAISSSLTHPNIVQTYTYSIKPVREHGRSPAHNKGFSMSGLGSAVQIFNGDTQTDSPSQENTMLDSDKTAEGNIHSFQVSLVLEYCDKGCLRDALDQGAFMTERGLNYAGILDSACDVARAMLHLHCNNILHMDLKARNILLASSGTEGRGVTCKASDFGLAVRMEQAETHMSGCFQGTLTHMAPETLLKGQVSKAADVYAFGIVLWELFTGGQPYKGIPKALLGHKIVSERHRPPLPFVMPQGYQALIQACWAPIPEHRPSFAQILDKLQALRSAVPGPTEPLGPIRRPLPTLPAFPSSKGRLSMLGANERSLPPTMSGTRHPLPRVGKAGSIELAAPHCSHSAECPVVGTSREPEQPASPAAAGQSAAPDASVPKARKMVRFFSTGAERGARSAFESGSTGTEGHGEGEGSACSTSRAASAPSEDGSKGATAQGGEVEQGRALFRRSNSMPSLGQEGEAAIHAVEQLPSGSTLPPNSSGSRFSSSGRSSHSNRHSSAGSTDSGSRHALRVVSPFDSEFGGSVGALFPLGPEQPCTPAESHRESGGSGCKVPTNARGRIPGSSSSSSGGSNSKSFPGSRRHHHHGSVPAHRSKRGHSHCVIIIGDENTDNEGNQPHGSQGKGRVELSGVHTKAVLGNTLDPIGEEENHEGQNASLEDLQKCTSA